MTEDQNFTYVLGQTLRIPWSPITLDGGRSLDGNETWLWELRKNELDASALISKTIGSGITVTSSLPTILLEASDFPIGSFPFTLSPKLYLHELRMVKSGDPEPIGRGICTVKTAIARV